MRLKLKVASAGQGCIIRFPSTIDDESEVMTGGQYDYAKCAAVIAGLADAHWITQSSTDGRTATIVMTAFAYNLRQLCDMMCADGEAKNRRSGTASAPHRAASVAADRRASRKVDRGDCSMVVVEVKDGARIRVRVSCDLKECGDMQREWCRDMATLCLEIADAMSEKHGGRMAVEEGAGAEGLLARARRINAESKAKMAHARMVEERRGCGRRVNGYCSPVDTACPFYSCGKCEWKELTK